MADDFFGSGNIDFSKFDFFTQNGDQDQAGSEAGHEASLEDGPEASLEVGHEAGAEPSPSDGSQPSPKESTDAGGYSTKVPERVQRPSPFWEGLAGPGPSSKDGSDAGGYPPKVPARIQRRSPFADGLTSSEATPKDGPDSGRYSAKAPVRNQRRTPLWDDLTGPEATPKDGSDAGGFPAKVPMRTQRPTPIWDGLTGSEATPKDGPDAGAFPAKVPVRTQRQAPFWDGSQQVAPVRSLCTKSNPFELLTKVETERSHLKGLIKEKEQEISFYKSRWQVAQKQINSIQSELHRAETTIKGKNADIESFNQRFEVVKDRFISVSERFRKFESFNTVMEKLKKVYKSECSLKDQLLRQFHAETEAKIRQARDIITQMQNGMDQRGQELASLIDQLKAKEGECIRMKQQYDQVVEKHDEFKSMSESETARLVEEMKKFQQEVIQLQTALTSKEESFKGLQAELASERDSLAHLKTEKELLEKKLEEQSNASTEALAAKAAEIQILQSEKDGLKQELEEVVSDLEKQVQELKSLREEFSTFQAKANLDKEELNQEKESLTKEVCEKSREVVALKTEIQSLELKVTDGGTELADTMSKLELKEAELTEANRKVLEVEGELVKANEKIDQMNVTFENKLNDSTLEYDELNSRNETLLENVRDLQKQAEEDEKRAKEMAAKYAEQINQLLHDVEKKNHEVRTFKDQLKETIAMKDAKIRRLNMDVERRGQQMDDYKRMYQEKLEEIENINSKLSATSFNMEQLSNQQQNMVRQNQNLKEKVASLERELEELKTEKRKEDLIVGPTPVVRGSPRKSAARKLFPTARRTAKRTRSLGFDSDLEEEDVIEEVKRSKAVPKKPADRKLQVTDPSELYLQATFSPRVDSNNRSAAFRTVKEERDSQNGNNRSRALDGLVSHKVTSDSSIGDSGEWF